MHNKTALVLYDVCPHLPYHICIISFMMFGLKGIRYNLLGSSTVSNSSTVRTDTRVCWCWYHRKQPMECYLLNIILLRSTPSHKPHPNHHFIDIWTTYCTIYYIAAKNT